MKILRVLCGWICIPPAEWAGGIQCLRASAVNYPFMILGSIIWCCGQMDLGF